MHQVSPTPKETRHRSGKIDLRHEVDKENDIVPEVTLANVQTNAFLLGLSHLEFILRAEKLSFTHDYDVALKEAQTQDARYLLLKKLCDNDLVQTAVYVRLVEALTHHCKNDGEREALWHAVPFCPISRSYVRSFCELPIMRRILVC